MKILLDLRGAHLTDVNSSPAYNTRSATARRMRLNRSRSPLVREESNEVINPRNHRHRSRRRLYNELYF